MMIADVLPRAEDASMQQEPSLHEQESAMDSPSNRTYCRQDLNALNLVDEPIWVFDIVRKAMWYANDAAVKLWSANSLEELLVRDFRKDMSESTMHRLDDYLLKFASDDHYTFTEQWTFYPNGQGPKTVDCKCKGVPIEEGRLALMIHATQKEATSETEKEALRSVEMLRHLPVAVCLTDLDGNIMTQNPEALAVFGSLDVAGMDGETKEEKAEEGSDSAFVKRFVDQELGRRILHDARTGKDVHRLEALQHTVLGPRWSAIQVRQTKDPVTSQPILLYSSRDITAVVEAKRLAVAADTAKMDLLADMAHAIRTPLQHVIGVVELMSQKPSAEDASDMRYSNLLQSSAQLLMTVLHDMMESVRSVNNIPHNKLSSRSGEPNSHPRIKLEHSHIDIQQVLDNAIATITPHAQVKDLSVRAQVTSHLRTVSVMGDANRLRQVLFEILHNAVKYTSRGGIGITVRRKSKKRSRRVRLRFEIKDTGVGLNLEQQLQCLGDNRDKGHDRRGLELCKTLVEAMGGEIGVNSKPGWGSTFWFEIPFLRAAASWDKQRSSGSLLDPVADDECDGDHDGGLQILLVDADDVGRKVMMSLLEQSGHTVKTAETGEEMIRVVSEESFDVVLLEIRLPPSSGRDALEATQEIRKMGYSPESLPILALTAAVPRADYPELGLNDWLTKPIVIKDIQKAMTNAICNVGTKSMYDSGSVFTADDALSIDGSQVSLGGSLVSLGVRSTSGPAMSRANTEQSPPSMPRRGSFNSIQSCFSDHLEAVLGSVEEPDGGRVVSPLPAPLEKHSLPPRSDSVKSVKSDMPPRMILRSTKK